MRLTPLLQILAVPQTRFMLSLHTPVAQLLLLLWRPLALKRGTHFLIFVLENPTSEELASRPPAQINNPEETNPWANPKVIPPYQHQFICFACDVYWSHSWFVESDSRTWWAKQTRPICQFCCIDTGISIFREPYALRSDTVCPISTHRAGRPGGVRLCRTTESETENLTHITCFVHGLDSDSASEYDSVESESDYADKPKLEPSLQTLQPVLNPHRWSIGGWIRSRAHSMSRFIPNFDSHSPVPEQSPTDSLPAAPVSPNVIKDKRQCSNDVSSRPKKSFWAREDVQYLRTKQLERTLARAQANVTKEAEALKGAQRKAEIATTPGQKRKHAPSPETIPNPKRL